MTTKGLGLPDESHTFGHKLEGGGFVSVKGEMAWVEASLPKRVGPDNIEGLTIPEAHEAIRGMVEDACQFVEPAASTYTTGRIHALWSENVPIYRDVSAANPKIVRLDLVRDFALHDPEALGTILDGLSYVPVAGRITKRRFADGQRGGAQTLSVGPRAWKATLYDKHRETVASSERRGGNGPVAAAGSLRYECRLHRDQLGSVFALESAGRYVRMVDDLTEDVAESLRRSWFERVGFDREVISVAGVWPIVKKSGLSPRQQLVFVGWLDARSRGESVQVSRDTERKYRNLAASLGIVCALETPQRDVTMRLDYETGRELVKVA